MIRDKVRFYSLCFLLFIIKHLLLKVGSKTAKWILAKLVQTLNSNLVIKHENETEYVLILKGFANIEQTKVGIKI